VCSSGEFPQFTGESDQGSVLVVTGVQEGDVRASQPSGGPECRGKKTSSTARWEQQRHQQSSQRICIEHAIAEPKQWRTMQRWIGRREYFEDTALAITGLVSDRAAAR